MKKTIVLLSALKLVITVIHTFTLAETTYVDVNKNVYSCKDYDPLIIEDDEDLNRKFEAEFNYYKDSLLHSNSF